MGDAVLCRVDGPVATVTLNRPEALNAQNEQWTDDLHAALDRIEADADLRCAVLTGAGRAFSAGGDLDHPTFSIDGMEARRPNVERGYRLVRRMRALPIPFIAAVNGPAVGAGVSMALACDLRIAARSAYFQLAFVDVGVLPDQGGTHLLPQVVGVGPAMWMALTGDRVDADEALRIGLVSEVVGDDELLVRAHELAGRLARKPPLALREIKHAVYDLPRRSFDDAMTIEAEKLNHLIGTDDCREAVAAFREQRPPKFRGR